MTNFPLSPRHLVRSLWQHQQLIVDLAKRDAFGKYKGSKLGVLWSLLAPIFMLTIYTFVFSEIFQARWTTGSSSKTEFAIVLFTGLIMFNFFAENVTRAPHLIVGNVNFVKKIVFPLEILACVNLVSAMFHLTVSLVVLLVFQVAIYGRVPLTFLLMPLMIMPLALFCLGIAWFLSAIGVFLRDVGQTIGIFVTGLMFLSPIFFPLSAIPLHWHALAKLNPLVFPIEQARNIQVWGNYPNWDEWLIYTLASTVIAYLGFAFFQKTRRGFADVL
ncbi:MAG: ABC transporter permease [Undibacterium sp.]|nr:ABC transporter permease [Undibacterium sp.]MDO9194751.1 ABC transporter permease [Undibacterium sp.]